MFGPIKRAGRLLWETLNEFLSDGAPQMAAALSYYTIFSLPPLLVMLMVVVGAFVDTSTVQTLLSGELGALLGPGGATQVETLLLHASRPEVGSLGALLGFSALVFGATIAFAQLQNALNTAWGVAPDPTRGDIKNFLLKRVISFAMILAIGFLLLVSLVLSALVAAFGDVVEAVTPERITAVLMRWVDMGISFAVVTLLFAAIFQYVPDAVVRWRDALVGGVFTAVLFTLGKAAIGFYIGRSDPGSAYGAAGSLAVVLVWIYYSANILFLGAEFTQVWARAQGVPIVPEHGAARVIRRQERYMPERN